MDLNTLPTELARGRILDSRSAAEYAGISLPHWRRMYRAGTAPKPIRIGERKYGWRVGDVADWLTEKSEKSAA